MDTDALNRRLLAGQVHAHLMLPFSMVKKKKTFERNELSFRRWLSQSTTCMMPKRKGKDM
jgi:hypothetical protein